MAEKFTIDISFGGSFFALVDIEQFGWHVDPQSIPQLTDFGMKLIEKVNAEVEIQHPELDITTVDLAELYCSTDTPGCDKRNVVILRRSYGRPFSLRNRNQRKARHPLQKR